MRRNAPALLALFSLAACQVPNTGTVHRTSSGNASSVTTSATSPSPKGTQTPVSLDPSAPPASLAPTTNVTGLIQLNPAYVISAGGGNVVSAGGGNVISAGGGNLITAGGGNLITAGGGNLITAGGGNLVTAGGGNYRLLDATASATADASATEELPASGMMVAAVSLETHQLLAPAVKTDATGHYALALPKNLDQNYAILAGFPGKTPNDAVLKNPELRFYLIGHADDSGKLQDFDETQSFVSYYLRNCARPYAQHLFFDADRTQAETNMLGDLLIGPDDPAYPLGIQFLDSSVQKMRGLLTSVPSQDQSKTVNALIDAALANTSVSLEAIPVSPLSQVDPGMQGKTPAQLILGVLDYLKTKANTNPAVLQNADFLRDPDTHAPYLDPITQQPFQVRNGLELERFVIYGLLTGNVSQPIEKVNAILTELGSGDSNQVVDEQRQALQVASMSIVWYLSTKLFEEGVVPAPPDGLIRLDLNTN